MKYSVILHSGASSLVIWEGTDAKAAEQEFAYYTYFYQDVSLRYDQPRG